MKTGDTVKHGPSGEEWVVAYVDRDYLAPCGWPPGEAKVADCTLVEECSEEESLALLRRLAEMRGDGRGPDRRALLAQDELRTRGLLPPLPLTDAEKLRALGPVLAVARDFVQHYDRGNGCGNCGGMPHTSECYVARFKVALESAEARP